MSSAARQPPAFTLQPAEAGWCGRFSAMASPCELLIEGASEPLARGLVESARDEAWRIERKFSRYRDDSVIAQMHRSRGTPLSVDDETALLLDFAGQCHTLSGRLFDVTSGVLRAAWRFDGSGHLPDPALVEALCRRIGWHRVVWQRPWFTLPRDMELDLGGIAKEYAIDRVLGLLMAQAPLPMLVNFGGDIVVSGPRSAGRAWQVGIERPVAAATLTGANATARSGAAANVAAGTEAAANVAAGAEAATNVAAGTEAAASVAAVTGAAANVAVGSAAGLIALSAGGLATSGDARRFLLSEGVRYGHILDPRSGWPVRDAPRSVTVAAPTCTEAGVLATLAMLQGAQAETWLAAQQMPHWVIR